MKGSSIPADAPVSEGAPRSHLIDLVRGILMVLVILGHITPWPGPWEPVRNWIYFFHMPLFFGISGWLTNPEKLVRESWGEFFSKIFPRLILPWLIAAVFFTLYIVSKGHPSPVEALGRLLKLIAHPWFHLWFIPALCAVIIFTKFLLRRGIRLGTIWLGAILVSLTWLLLNDNNNYGDGAVAPFGDKRVLTMFPYFLGGLWLRKLAAGRWPDLSSTWAYAGMGVMLALMGLISWGAGKTLSDILWVGANLVLVALVCFLFRKGENPAKAGFLCWMGSNTLPIYLWHVLPIVAARLVFDPDKYVYSFWAVALIGIGIFLSVLFQVQRHLAKGGHHLIQLLVFGLSARPVNQSIGR